jgi:hypothetical protein
LIMNKKSLAVGILLGIAVVVSLGIVYIDTISNSWRLGGAGNAYVQLLVSNRLVMAVHTNTGFIGINSTNQNFFAIDVQTPAIGTNATGNGTSGNSDARINVKAGTGGSTFETTSASGGQGGPIFIAGGSGGTAPFAVTNATGGFGGDLQLGGGNGGVGNGVATNSSTGGGGGSVNISGGNGGSTTAASTNTVGGNGGGFSVFGGAGTAPGAGWARKSGNGGGFSVSGGNGGTGVRTNGGNGGTFSMTAGNAGSASTGGDGGVPGGFTLTAGNAGSASGGGNTQPGGSISLVAGNGNTGLTNSDGGHVYIAGGSPGSGARPGDTHIGRLIAGTGRGGLVVGISNSAVLTNVMFVRTNLDFPSTLAQTDSDIPVLAVTGMTNAIVNVGPPAPAILTGSAWSGFCSNGTVFVRFSVYGLVAKDPGVGDFAVEIRAYR